MNIQIEKELKWIKNYIKIFLTDKKTPMKKIYLVGTPIYGNLGDQAIALAEYKYFENMNYSAKIVEIPSLYIARHTALFKFIIGKSDIYVTGGGFMGTLWPKEENMIRSVVKTFKKNKITILPQTVFYENTKEGKTEKENARQIYGQHSNLHWFLRETVSYDCVKEMLPNGKVYLCPDMALLLNTACETEKVRKNILMCLRSDKEKNLTKNDLEKIEATLKKYCPNEELSYTDTVLKKNVWLKERNYEVYKKIEEFSNAKLIVTDRLHGMVFAAIAQTPCIVCGNINYKVKGIYQWIKENKYIRYVEKIEEIVKELSEYQNPQYDSSYLKEQYKVLEWVIKN